MAMRMIACTRKNKDGQTVYAVERRGEFALTIGIDKADGWYLISERTGFRNEDRLMKAYKEKAK